VAREYFESIVIAVILALFIRTFVVQAFKIPTGSMEPNLLVGDHLLVNKFVFSPTDSAAERALLPAREIRRGDIVVFKFPTDPERDFIKRVIGLPGETVELKNRRIFINGRPIDEPYAHYLPRPDARRGDVRGCARSLRARDGSDRISVRHGRQPRQFPGLALLGVLAARQHQGPGADDLLVLRPRRGWAPQRPDEHPLGSFAASDSLIWAN
jgi:signal peptidase I